MKKLLPFFLCLFLFCFSTAQEEQATQKTIQPTIMVIPFAKENQDMRTVLENNLNLRVGVTKVKEGFDNRGFSTVDFRAKLKQVNNDNAMEMANQSSIKQQVIELSGADMYVEVESAIKRTKTGNSVTVIMTAYDAFSGQSIANKVSTSPKFYTENFEKLTEKAVNAVIEDFLNVMQEKFTEIINNGRTLVVNIGFTENSEYDMDSEMGDEEELLSDIIERWIEANAYKNYYHLQGVTATKMMLDDVRIPLKDNNGRNYRASRFAGKLRNFLKKLGFDVTRDVQGTKIFITIN